MTSPVLPIRPDEVPWEGQIPADVDITHFQFNPRSELSKPYLVTEHGNARKPAAAQHGVPVA